MNARIILDRLVEAEAEPQDVQPASASAHLYKFSELSPSSKQRAIQNAEAQIGYNWADEAIQSLKALSGVFHGRLKDWDIDWTNSSPSRADFDMPEMEPAEVEEILKGLGTYDEQTLKGHGDCHLTGFHADEDAIDGFRKAWHAGVQDLNELMKAAFDSWLAACQADYADQYTEEQFNEMAEANEWTYLRNGEMFFP